MDYSEFCRRLHLTCANAIDAYRTQYPEKPPLSEQFEDNNSRLASTDDVNARFAELTDFYDDLFDVDSTPYRDLWREHLLYDCSRQERLALLGSDLPSSLTFTWITGRYAGHTGHIGVSSERKPAPRAYSLLASELCHAYQHRFDSPTWQHPYLQEGFEKAASLRALAYLGRELNDDAVAHRACRRRTKAFLAGTIAHGIRRGGITANTVRGLGVTEEELAGYQADFPWRLLGQVKPRYHWDSIEILPEYDMLGSLLLVSESEEVSDPFAKAFHGKHPWEVVIADIQSTKPSWFWRRHHTRADPYEK